MLSVCVASRCSNQKDKAKGIPVHTVPFFEVNRVEARKRRKIWVDFIEQRRT